MAEEGKVDTNQDISTENKESLLDGAGKETILDEAAQQAKEAQETEDKRILDADETTLSDEDKEKRGVLVKSQEDKKLLETKDEDLTEEEKARKKVLVDAKEAEANKDKSKNKAPEKYEFKVPEGMTVDQALADKVSPLFKEVGLTQEQAQKLVDVYAEHIKTLGVEGKAAEEKSFQKFLEESRQETVKELGADYKKELAFAAKVRNRLLSPETIELFNSSGLANNVNLIKDLISIGKLISEDKIVDGKTATAGGKTLGQALYPEQGKK